MSRAAVPTAYRPSPEEAKERRRYEVEDAMRTLTRAEQIRREPKLMADVRTLATDLKKIAGREPPKPIVKAPVKAKK